MNANLAPRRDFFFCFFMCECGHSSRSHFSLQVWQGAIFRRQYGYNDSSLAERGDALSEARCGAVGAIPSNSSNPKWPAGEAASSEEGESGDDGVKGESGAVTAKCGDDVK